MTGKGQLDGDTGEVPATAARGTKPHNARWREARLQKSRRVTLESFNDNGDGGPALNVRCQLLQACLGGVGSVASLSLVSA